MDELNFSDKEQDAQSIVSLLFHKSHNEMLAFAFTMLKDKEEAKDIVAIAFHRVFESSQVFESLPNAQSYLFIVVRNLCLDSLKNKQINRKRHRKFLEETYEPVITQEEIEKNLHKSLNISKWLGKQLSTLQPAAEKILKSAYFGEKKNKEIASEMNITEETVASQKSKALHQLRKNNPNLPEDLIPLVLLIMELNT